MNDRIAVTGIGLATSLGLSREETWRNLLAGLGRPAPAAGFDAGGFPCPVAYQLEELTPESLGVPPRDARVMTQASLVLLKTGLEALQQANESRPAPPAEQTAFFGSLGMVDPEPSDLAVAARESSVGGNFDLDRFLARAYTGIHPLWPLTMLNNVGFCLAAIGLGTTGENAVFSPGADSGVMALAEAAISVGTGRSSRALAGGAGEKVLPWGLVRAHQATGLSPASEDRGPCCQPFAAGRTGTVLGEGGAVLVLEPLNPSTTGKPLALVRGWGLAGGNDLAAAHRLSMNRALAQAGRTPDEIDLLLPHGDGTVDGDGAEMRALRDLLAERPSPLPVWCSKRQLGHLLAGAAATDAALAALMLHTGRIPPGGAGPLAAEADRLVLADGRNGVEPLRVILVNARSWSGTCASVILEKVN